MTLTTAEQALIDEVVFDQIVEFMEDVDVSRRVFPVVYKNEGDSIKIVKEGRWPKAVEIGQGAEVPIFQPTYKQVSEIYKKIGYRAQITHEMIEDSRWDLVERAALNAGQQLGLKMSIDVLREAWGTAGVQTFTVSGRWGGANSDIIGDLSECMGKLRSKNYIPDLLVLHPADYAHLATLDEFVDRSKAPEGKDLRSYEVGRVMGMDVITTAQMSENNFLMLDTRRAGNLYIREDLRRASYTDVPRDVEGQVFFIRYKEAVVAPSAIVFATGY